MVLKIGNVENDADIPYVTKRYFKTLHLEVSPSYSFPRSWLI